MGHRCMSAFENHNVSVHRMIALSRIALLHGTRARVGFIADALVVSGLSVEAAEGGSRDQMGSGSSG